MNDRDDASTHPRVVLTIGHSVHSLDAFLGLVKSVGCDAVVDVRSAPFSRWRPHFNRDALAKSLPGVGVSYLPMGDALGGRPTDESLCGPGGIADYEAMASSPSFERGLMGVLSLAGEGRPVLMCSEGDPMKCHRCLLVGRGLMQRGACVEHVLPDGSTRSQRDVEDEILREAGHDLFSAVDERLASGYRARAERYAHRRRA